MPEAIATTKRKFYKALDAITSASQMSLKQHQAEAFDSTSKRPAPTATEAFDEALERARKRPRQSTSTSSLSTANRSSSAASLVHKLPNPDGTAAKPLSYFSPWSHETFLARLKTFSSVSLWHPKPEVIDELRWAKRGWMCVDVNTVACKGGCEKRVVVSLEAPEKLHVRLDEGDIDGSTTEDGEDSEDTAAAYVQALARRYESVIVEGHASNCLWRKAGCKDDIYRLPVVRPTVWQPDLRKRFRSLLDIGMSIDHVQLKAPAPNKADSLGPTALTSPKHLMEGLPADILSAEDVSSPTAERSLEIAMHGWRGSSQAGTHLLHCDDCFQRIGLWMYQPNYRPRRQSHDDDPDSGEDTAVIDLLGMHREYCPWQNARSQHALGSLDGLNATQILHQVVAGCARDHRRRTQEQSRPAMSDDDDDAVEGASELPPQESREEVARQDKERESRLRKLKNLFIIKRRPARTLPQSRA